MTLSYLVSTAGHAQAQNELDPHNIETILQLVQEGSNEFQDEKVVGFTSLTAEQEWTCETYCGCASGSSLLSELLMYQHIPSFLVCLFSSLYA
jgi:hypothetical protein